VKVAEITSLAESMRDAFVVLTCLGQHALIEVVDGLTPSIALVDKTLMKSIV
jgi:hypothetical protein